MLDETVYDSIIKSTTLPLLWRSLLIEQTRLTEGLQWYLLQYICSLCQICPQLPFSSHFFPHTQPTQSTYHCPLSRLDHCPLPPSLPSLCLRAELSCWLTDLFLLYKKSNWNLELLSFEGAFHSCPRENGCFMWFLSFKKTNKSKVTLSVYGAYFILNMYIHIETHKILLTARHLPYREG